MQRAPEGGARSIQGHNPDKRKVCGFQPEERCVGATTDVAVKVKKGLKDQWLRALRRSHCLWTWLAGFVDSNTNAQIEAVPNAQRREIIRTITTKYRERKFRGAILGAYKHQCAFCRVQLSLLDAAHILPVSAPGSTDEIVNGVALCKLHHFAYDGNLVSFDTRYRIAVSRTRVAELEAASRHGGLAKFEAGLRPSLYLPAHPSHRPNPTYIAASRSIRGWRP